MRTDLPIRLSDGRRLANMLSVPLPRRGAESPFTVGVERTSRVLVCLAGDGQVEHDGAYYAIGKGDVPLLPAVVEACL